MGNYSEEGRPNGETHLKVNRTADKMKNKHNQDTESVSGINKSLRTKN